MDDHTFVITVYKESPYLDACIKSLIGQTVKSKIIIATSTPTSFSQNIASKYNIPYYINNTGQTGIAADWNFAMAKADTKLVTIAHQDDIYSAEYAEIITTTINSHRNKQVLMAFTNYTDLVNNKIRTFSINSLVKQSLLLPFFFSKAVSGIFLKKAMLIFGNPVCCPSVTFNMEQTHDFEFSTDYTYVLDWFAWYQLAQQPGAFVYINKKLVSHRLHPESETTNLLGNGVRHREEIKLFNLIWDKRIGKIIAWIYKLGQKNNL